MYSGLRYSYSLVTPDAISQPFHPSKDRTTLAKESVEVLLVLLQTRRVIFVMSLLENFVKAFIPLFVAIDPIGLAAIFVTLSRDIPVDRKHQIARQATWTGGGVALAFLLLGRSTFQALGITVGDFQIAGGLILFILATRDLLRPVAERAPKLAEDFGVVPLGMPLIAGPALITTLLLLSQTIGSIITLWALVANLILVSLTLAFSERLTKLVGLTGLRAFSKIVALLLAAIAINMIRHGLAPV